MTKKYTDLIKPKIGVIGGMGTLATLDFFSKIVRNTHIESERDHVSLIIDNNPSYPDRTEAIRHSLTSLPIMLQDTARRLAKAGATHLVMPCNTAHKFADAVKNATDLPFVSAVEETGVQISKNIATGNYVGVMESDGCKLSGLYRNMLLARGYMVITPRRRFQKTLMKTIYRVKQSKTDHVTSGFAQEVADHLIQCGAQAIVAACTEIPIVLEQEMLNVPLFDTTDILARQCVAISNQFNSQKEPKSYE